MKHSQRLVILGDSVTAAGQTENGGAGGGYVDLLSERLASEGVRAELIASALDGIDTGYAVRRFRRMVTSLAPDQVLVMLGLNDAQPAGGRAQSSPAEFERNLGRLVELILELDALPTLITPNPRFDVSSSDPHADDIMPPYVQSVIDVADSYMIGCIDVHRAFCGVDSLGDLIPDGIHPAADGHRVIAEAIADQLLSKLRDAPTEPQPGTDNSALLNN